MHNAGVGDLSPEERAIVLECLRASLEGPFFPEWEFHTLFGLTRPELARVVAAWPNLDEIGPNARHAINNALNNLTGYPHGCEAVWSQFISVPVSEVARVYAKWRRGGSASEFS